MKLSTLQDILRLREQKVPIVVVTDLDSGVQRVVRHDAVEADSAYVEAAQRALREDDCQRVEVDGRRWFIQPFNPPLRMHIVGAVHIAQPLARMASDIGYEVTLIDPRAAFAREERFADLAVRSEWPDEALEAVGIDARTAVITLTHDPKLDDPALAAALRSEAFYIGSLGSTRTHSARLRRLTEEGFDEHTLARIHGPVGLPIGARSPAEIAVAILGQVTQVLRKPTS